MLKNVKMKKKHCFFKYKTLPFRYHLDYFVSFSLYM